MFVSSGLTLFVYNFQSWQIEEDKDGFFYKIAKKRFSRRVNYLFQICHVE